METPFNLDAWKREFSNSEGADQSMAWLKTNFDPKEFSLFQMKLDDLPKIDFIRSNRINGYFQGFEPIMHKISFGAGIITAPDKSSFVWIFKGLDIPNEMKESPMFDSATDWAPLSMESNLDLIKSHFFSEDEDNSFIFK